MFREEKLSEADDAAFAISVTLETTRGSSMNPIASAEFRTVEVNPLFPTSSLSFCRRAGVNFCGASILRLKLARA